MKITMNKKVEKIKLVLEIIQAQRKLHPRRETFSIPSEEFSKLPILRDYNGLMLAFKEIEKETKENVLISISENEDSLAKKWMPVPPIITAHIEDFQEFDRYRKHINQTISDEKSISLILNSQGRLYNKKEPRLFYPMELGGLRYKIVHSLASNKDWIATKGLAEEFGKTSQEIRKTIEQIKRMIEKLLKITGDKVIENKKGLGYRIAKVKIKKE